MNDPITQFKGFISSLGLECPDELITDGKLHRFSGSGRRGDKSSFYLLHADGVPAGCVGDWRSGLKANWKATLARPLTEDERRKQKARIDAQRRMRNAQIEADRAEAKAKAERIWDRSNPVEDHPYLTAKGVTGHGLRIYRGLLLVPVIDPNGELTSLQFIAASGEKRFLTGGAVAGGSCLLGDPAGASAIVVCEGWATGATIHEATGLPVFLGFNSGNLLAVAKQVRSRYPADALIIGADDDTWTHDNPGLTKAREAAQAVIAALAVPDFGPGRIQGDTDFNDLARRVGKDAVTRQVLLARLVDSPDGHSAAEVSSHSPSAPNGATQDEPELKRDRRGEPAGHGDDASSETDEGAQAAARNSARSAALRGEALADIARRIRRQWPPLAGEAESLGKAAIEWAGRFSDGRHIQVGGVEKEVVTLDGLNARFAQLEVPGMASCVIHTTDVLPVSHKDFQARVSGQVVIVGVNKDGSPKCIPASRAWRESCLKKTFTEIAFSAGTVKPSALNLFTGFGVDAVPGDCPKILEHIHQVICAGDDAAYEGFLNLLAWQIKHIGRPSRIVVVLFSREQQIGKGSLLEHVMLPIAGLGGFMSHDPSHGLGNFNDQLRGKWFLFLDECSFAGDRKLADKIKSLAVAQTTPIEGKGLPVISLPAALNIYLATNHEHAANAELHDQRYWFLRVNPSKAGDHDYFTGLYDEIENGGREAFLHLLLNRDVSDFKPQRDLPRENEMLADVKRRSLFPGHVAQWLQESLEAGELLWVRGRADENHRQWADGHDSVQGSLLHAGYREWVGRVRDRHAREVPLQDFWQCLSALGFDAWSSNGRRHRKIPSPEDCNQRLDDFINGSVAVEAV